MSGTKSPGGSRRQLRQYAKAGSIGCGTASASGAPPPLRQRPRRQPWSFYVAFLPPRVAPEQIAALDERLARIEDAARGLVGVPGEIAALGDRLASLASRVDAVASRPTHVAVLLDKDQRPMMTADLDIADGRLVLRLNLTPPRDFTANVLEVWLVSPDGMRRSLGLFPSERPGTTAALFLPHDTAEALAKAVLAVSLEPRGGSTTGQPSGPVLFTGALMPVAL